MIRNNQNIDNQQQGFTLLELVVALAIIGLIASFALPAYQNYIARTQAAEAFQLLGPLKLELFDSVHNSSKCVAKNSVLNEQKIGQEGKYASAIIANPANYNIQLAQNTNTGNATTTTRAPREDTGCRILVGYKPSDVSAKLAGRHFTLAFLYNGELVLLPEQGGDVVPANLIPENVEYSKNNYIVAEKYPKGLFEYKDIIFTKTSSISNNDQETTE